MLAISNESGLSRRLMPNLLPCSIKHDGPVDAEPRHWSPGEVDGNDISTAYFRGRKLRGRAVKVPDGYQGLVLQRSGQLLPPKAPTAEQLRRAEEEQDDEEEAEIGRPVEVGLMQPVATFDKIAIWDHEAVPNDGNEYVKGIREWMTLAAVMHSHDTPASDQKRT